MNQQVQRPLSAHSGRWRGTDLPRDRDSRAIDADARLLPRRAGFALLTNCFLETQADLSIRWGVSTLVFLCAAAWWIAVASAQPRPIDVQTSTLIVRVYKAGILSAFGHDHEIGAVF